MKKTTILPALLAGTMTLAGCGAGSTSTAGQGNLIGSIVNAGVSGIVNQGGNAGNETSNTETQSSGILGNLLSGLLGANNALSQKNLIGTWTYAGSDCVFESENFLMKAGGEVASAKIEKEINTQLAKVGIKEGACSFTFNEDNSYTAKIGSRTIKGQYTLDAEKKVISMTYLGGLRTMTPHISKSGDNISILFESSKLLNLLKATSALSGNTSLKTVNSLLSKYDGLYVGMKLAK